MDSRDLIRAARPRSARFREIETNPAIVCLFVCFVFFFRPITRPVYCLSLTV